MSARVMTAEEYRRSYASRSRCGRGASLDRKPKRADGYDSALEAAYAEHLEQLRLAGEISAWMHHPFPIRLARGARYTPDFLVARSNAKDLRLRDIQELVDIELHEVKGFWREAALVRVKVARDRHPWFRFVVVSRESAKSPWRTQYL